MATVTIGLLKPEPFATLTAVSGSFFHPESYYDENVSFLKEKAISPEEQQPPWLRMFKFEAKEYLLGNTEGFDDRKFFRDVQFDDGRTEMFIRRAWAEIFPDDPIPGFPLIPFDSLYTVAHIYFQSSHPDPDDYFAHPNYLKHQLKRSDRELSPLLRAIKSDLTRMLNGNIEGLYIPKFRTKTFSFYYKNNDDLEFARHVWRYLFPNEPLPEPAV